MFQVCACGALAALDGYSPQQDPDQFHIQTDEDDERYFLYQTHNGQYRKERRLKDGSVVGMLKMTLKHLNLLIYLLTQKKLGTEICQDQVHSLIHLMKCNHHR